MLGVCVEGALVIVWGGDACSTCVLEELLRIPCVCVWVWVQVVGCHTSKSF